MRRILTFMFTICMLMVFTNMSSALWRRTKPSYSKKITWYPKSASQWNFVNLVKQFQRQTPRRYVLKLKKATARQLAKAHSVSFQQDVDDGLGMGKRKLGVEITQGLINVPFRTFMKRLPAAKWGVNLDHYLGGQVKVYAKDKWGRPTKQLERMVLSGMPFNLSIKKLDMDMTKLEHIVYGRNKAVVYWRVMYSDNGSTVTDVGSVSFMSHGRNMTKVVFHSAHKLATPLGQIPNILILGTLRSFFSDHIKYYRKLVTK